MPVCHAECTRAHIFPVCPVQRLRGVFSAQVCIPVFSSLQRTKRPCSKNRRALMYKEQMSCALASKSGAWLLSQ